MASRTRAQAVESYRAQRAVLLSCVTSAHVFVGSSHRPGPFADQLSLAGGDAVRLADDGPLTLRVNEQYKTR